ncbi:MAG TPA: hypothetical protein PLM25_09785, partial [Limnochordia bacterium]|nr:hypothetical protein [Limnochordia bacterium]
ILFKHRAVFKILFGCQGAALPVFRERVYHSISSAALSTAQHMELFPLAGGQRSTGLAAGDKLNVTTEGSWVSTPKIHFFAFSQGNGSRR